MGLGLSRHQHGHARPHNAEPQQRQQPATQYQQYPYPYPAARGGQQDTGFVPFAPYPPGMHHYGQNRGQMPQHHAHNCPPPQHGSTANAELHQTKTIRNRVNLKKPTLRMVKMEDDENKMIPRFVFDASAPCSVTVFYMAQEDTAKKSKLTSVFQVPGPRAMYGTGLAQEFPPKGKESDYALDLTMYEEGDLTSVQGNVTFPLIIRLETVTENTTEERSLEELPPGCPTPTWIQSQTTYAYLVRDEDDGWKARTVKQKIWVDGISYELQEIYGIQEFYTPQKKPDKIDTFAGDIEGRECVICLAAVRDTTVLPCRHMCMCADCARELQRQQVSNCPICRDTIESLLHIKRPQKKSLEASGGSESDAPASTTKPDEAHTSSTDIVKST